MVIISKTITNNYGKSHAETIESLNEWYDKTKSADWKYFSQIKQTFNSVDFVGNDRYVFNIMGNQYRLVTMIFFDIRTVFIRFIGSHAEYDKIDASTI